MGTDKLFYKLALHFPQAMLSFVGIETQVRYHTESVTLKEKELRLDTVLMPDEKNAPRVLMEFQGYRDETLLLRFLASAALYCYQERYQGSLLSVVIFTQQVFAQNLLPTVFQLQDETTLLFAPKMSILETAGEEAVMSQGKVELIPLLPLCGMPEEKIRTEAQSWRARIEGSPLSDADKKTLVSLLGGFILHRLGSLSITELNQLLGEFQMENTKAGQELIEMGRIKGIEQGVQQGLQQGLLEARRDDIQRILKKRFQIVRRSVINKLAMIDSADLAGEILEFALEAESIEAFNVLLTQTLED